MYGEGIYVWKNQYTEGNTYRGGIYTEEIYILRNKYMKQTYTCKRYIYRRDIYMKKQIYQEIYT